MDYNILQICDPAIFSGKNIFTAPHRTPHHTSNAGEFTSLTLFKTNKILNAGTCTSTVMKM